MAIANLTRKILPQLSRNSADNISAIKNMPENILRSLIKGGQKDIVYVDMNRCAAAVIKKGGVQTVFTDGLAGCNSVGAIIPLTTGDKLCILSHYVPTNRTGQVGAIAKQLETYSPWISKDTAPNLFFNLSDKQMIPNVSPSKNPIIEEVSGLFKKTFSREPKVNLDLYQTSNRPNFFSSANIFQFDSPNNMCKVTNVGEKEHFEILA